MASGWYVAKNKQKLGPFSSMKLKELADSGELLPTDVVHREDMPKWIPASQIKGLFPSQGVTAQPVSPAPQPEIPKVVSAAQPLPGISVQQPSPTPTPGQPWWKRLLHETQAMGVATWAQTVRLARFPVCLWRRRSARRAFANAQLALGEHINERKEGDRQVQEQIAILEENIRQAEQDKKSAVALKAERKCLILQLASNALAQGTSSAEPE